MFPAGGATLLLSGLIDGGGGGARIVRLDLASGTRREVLIGGQHTASPTLVAGTGDETLVLCDSGTALAVRWGAHEEVHLAESVGGTLGGQLAGAVWSSAGLATRTFAGPGMHAGFADDLDAVLAHGGVCELSIHPDASEDAESGPSVAFGGKGGQLAFVVRQPPPLADQQVRAEPEARATVADLSAGTMREIRLPVVAVTRPGEAAASP